MKARRSTVLVPISFLVLVGVIVAVGAIGHLRYRYSPSVEHQSAFLRNYSPRPVIELFAFKQDPLSIGDGAGSGAGWKFVTNERKIGPTFAIQTDIRTPLSEDLVVLIFSRGNRQQHAVVVVLGRQHAGRGNASSWC